jgi:DNA/RNA endonuclease YhcR with UshA esterase domain
MKLTPIIVSAGIILFCTSCFAPSAEINKSSNLAQQSAIAQSNSINYTDAPKYIGKEVIVSGRVIDVFVSKTNTTFINFCKDYRSCPFSAVIFADDRSRFGDLQKLIGETVQISGIVNEYKGNPQIILQDPSQLR